MQLTELEEKVNGLDSIARRVETTANDAAALQQKVGSLQTKINGAANDTSALQQKVGSLQATIEGLEFLGMNIAKAQKGQAARLETLLSSLYFQQISPQGQAAVYIDPDKRRNLQAR